MHAAVKEAGTVGKKLQAVQAVAAATSPADADPGTPAPAPRVIGQVQPSTLKLEQYVNNSWVAIAPKDSLPVDFHLNPAPFDLLPKQVARFDTLRLIDPAEKWVANLICVERLTGHAVFALVNAIDLPPRQGDTSDRVPAGYEVVQGGVEDSEGWLVRRVSDGVILNRHRHTPSKEDATRFLLDHPTVRGIVHQSIF